MSTRIECTCDGCGDVRFSEAGLPSDWKDISVDLDGFSGYPVSDKRNGIRCYDLCTKCQPRLVNNADPTTWDRPARPAP